MESLPNVGTKVKRIFEVRMDKNTTIPNNPEPSLIAKKASEISLRRFMIKKTRYLYLRFLVVVFESLQGEAATCSHSQANKLLICLLSIG